MVTVISHSPLGRRGRTGNGLTGQRGSRWPGAGGQRGLHRPAGAAGECPHPTAGIGTGRRRDLGVAVTVGGINNGHRGPEREAPKAGARQPGRLLVQLHRRRPASRCHIPLLCGQTKRAPAVGSRPAVQSGRSSTNGGGHGPATRYTVYWIDFVRNPLASNPFLFNKPGVHAGRQHRDVVFLALVPGGADDAAMGARRDRRQGGRRHRYPAPSVQVGAHGGANREGDRKPAQPSTTPTVSAGRPAQPSSANSGPAARRTEPGTAASTSRRAANRGPGRARRYSEPVSQYSDHRRRTSLARSSARLSIASRRCSSWGS